MQEEGVTMAKENEAVVVINEGTDQEAKYPDGFGCCWGVFIYTFF
jgi:hypothetical protein